MKQTSSIVIISIWLLCVAVQCESDKCHKTIAFVNSSSKEVYIVLDFTYPDTSRFSSSFPNPYSQPDIYRVKQGEKNSNGLRQRDCLDSDVKQGRLVVYVFDAEVLANYSWGVIGKDYMVLKTIRPTLEEMESSNWTITFTGQ